MSYVAISLCFQQQASLGAQPYGQFYNMGAATYWNGAYPSTYGTMGPAAAQGQYLQAGGMGQWQPTYPSNYQAAYGWDFMSISRKFF